jgi:hypothetical protein
MGMKPDIEIHIEELVLRGFPHGDRHRIAGAIEQELTRLFSDRQDLPRMIEHAGHIEAVDGGQCRIDPGAKPGSIGQQIARAVYKGIGE